MTRVIGGRFGGRTLRTPAGAATRPTSDRVREALFSVLGELDSERVLDLFAGSGALGIEAISRGAGHATFVERSAAALAALRRNLRELQLRSPVVRVQALEAHAALRMARSRGDIYDLVFLDPPYQRAAEYGETLAGGLGAVLAPGARVVCETDRRRPLELPLQRAFERSYGDTLIQILK